jgi:hypothetical protein
MEMDDNRRHTPPKLHPANDRNRTLSALAIAAIVVAGITLWSVAEEVPNRATNTNVERSK